MNDVVACVGFSLAALPFGQDQVLGMGPLKAVGWVEVVEADKANGQQGKWSCEERFGEDWVVDGVRSCCAENADSDWVKRLGAH